MDNLTLGIAFPKKDIKLSYRKRVVPLTEKAF
jgi:hypothetical protein